MELRILQAIYDLAGLDQRPVRPEALRAHTHIETAGLIRLVKALADKSLIQIDEETGYLSLTSVGSERITDDAPSAPAGLGTAPQPPSDKPTLPSATIGSMVPVSRRAPGAEPTMGTPKRKASPRIPEDGPGLEPKPAAGKAVIKRAPPTEKVTPSKATKAKRDMQTKPTGALLTAKAPPIPTQAPPGRDKKPVDKGPFKRR